MDMHDVLGGPAHVGRIYCDSKTARPLVDRMDQRGPRVNCQECSHQELLESLRVTLQEAIDDDLARKICKDLGVKPIK